MIDLRFVIRDGFRILQWRQKKSFLLGKVGTDFTESDSWTVWEDVRVESEEPKAEFIADDVPGWPR